MRKQLLALLLTLLLLLGLLPAGALAAEDKALTLGALPGDMIFGGGTLVQRPEGLYSLRDEGLFLGDTLLTKGALSCLNVLDRRAYYVRDGAALWALDLDTGTETLLTELAQAPRQLYAASDGCFYYLAGDEIYVWQPGAEARLLRQAENCVGFWPAAQGLIWARGSLFRYALYAEDRLLAPQAEGFYLDPELDRIVWSQGGTALQMDQTGAFAAAKAQAFTGHGQVDVRSIFEDCAPPEPYEEPLSETRGIKLAANRKTLSQGVQNIVRRAEQMLNITWTPLADVTGWGGGLIYRAGTTYTGLPYGQPVYASYVPWNTSLSQFAAYVRDPGSKLYTSQSTYNKVAPYYSCDCSAFVSWAWNLPARQTTASVASYATRVGTQSYTAMEVGDCLNKSGSHVVLVTDMTYDDSGVINGVRISESTVNTATSYCCQSTWYGPGYPYSLAQLQAKYFGDGYVLYRSKTRDSAAFTHCCAVPLEGEYCQSCGAGMDQVSARGIDVSHHQQTIDWTQVKDSVDFAILRCAYSTSTDDRQWAANVQACTALDIPFGVYIYSLATTEEEIRAEGTKVLDLLEGWEPQLPVYLDLEDSSTIGSLSSAQILELVQVFCDMISAAGYTPGVYSSYNWWTTKLTDPAYDQWSRWIARYNDVLGYTGRFDVWQYSSTGTVPGISGNVDLNCWFNSFPGAPHSHSYTQTVTQEPSCTEPGVRTFTCLCGDSYTEPIPALGHLTEGAEWLEITAPSCQAEGLEACECLRCGEIVDRALPKTDHQWLRIYSAPTCTENASYHAVCVYCEATETQVSPGGWTEWLTDCPPDIPAERVESRQEYRWREQSTLVNGGLVPPDSEALGWEWVLTDSGTVGFVEEWPQGFDFTGADSDEDDPVTGAALYAQYNNQLPDASETDNTRSEVGEPSCLGYLYWHWCRGVDSLNAGYNRAISLSRGGNSAGDCTHFDAFFSTTPPEEAAGTNGAYQQTAYKFVRTDTCGDTYWWYALPVYGVSYANYEKQYSWLVWSPWSEWEPQAPESAENRQIEERSVQRFLTDSYGGHDWGEAVLTLPSCTEAGSYGRSCLRCGARENLEEAGMTPWLYALPEAVPETLMETGRFYRSRPAEFCTAADPSLEGWELFSQSWQQTETGVNVYVESWPGGFDRSHALYSAYNGAEMENSETEREKLTVTEPAVQGWIYWHWCRDSYHGGPINRRISPVQTTEFGGFHAFYSTVDPASLSTHDASDDSYVFPNGDCCTDSHWYFALPVLAQQTTRYEKEYCFRRWLDWSDWSQTPVQASDGLDVETETRYRVSLAALGHDFQPVETVAPSCTEEGYTAYRCSRCGAEDIGDVTPALGHDFSILVEELPPTATEDGLAEYRCSRCEQTQLVVLPATGETGPIEISDLEIRNNISLGAEFIINYRLVNNAAFKAYGFDSFWFEFIRHNLDGSTTTTLYGEGKDQALYANGSRSFDLKNDSVPAAEMGVTYEVIFHGLVGDQEYYTAPMTGSLKSFFVSQLESVQPEDYNGEARLRLAADSLLYAAKAQAKFNPDQGDLLADLSETALAKLNQYGTQEAPAAENQISYSDDGLVNPTIRLSLQSRLEVTVRYTDPNAETPVVVEFWPEGNEAAKISLPATLKSSTWSAVISQIGAAGVRDLYRFRVLANGVPVTNEAVWSVESYVAATRGSTDDAAMVDVLNAVLNFGDSVVNCFN